MKWLLNSAVIPAGGYGVYEFRPGTWEELREFLAAGDFVSRIGYADTAAMIVRETGIPELSLGRELPDLAPGDVAGVVRRRRWRVSDTTRKVLVDPDDWEVGFLERKG